jgi:hypothetical protein
MRIVAWPLLTMFFLPLARASIPSDIYHYEPQIVKLRGTIELQTFPGRPGTRVSRTGTRWSEAGILGLTNQSKCGRMIKMRIQTLRQKKTSEFYSWR